MIEVFLSSCPSEIVSRMTPVPWPSSGLRAKRHCSSFKQLRCLRLVRYAAMVSQRLLTSIMSISPAFVTGQDVSVMLVSGAGCGDVIMNVTGEGCGASWTCLVDEASLQPFS